MSFQKCEKCDRPATHKFTRIVEGHAIDFFFCQEHAAEFSPLQLKSTLNAMELTQLLAGLLQSEQGKKAEAVEAEAGELKCHTCGQSFRQYRQTMLLGCSDCYQAFEKQLRDDLRRYHGTVRHPAKPLETRSGAASEKEKLAALEKRLALAIQDEDFELAAQLRDEIRRLTPSAEKEC